MTPCGCRLPLCQRCRAESKPPKVRAKSHPHGATHAMKVAADDGEAWHLWGFAYGHDELPALKASVGRMRYKVEVLS